MSFVNHLLSDQLKQLLIEADQKQSTLNYLEKKNRNLVLEKRRNERLYSNRISKLNVDLSDMNYSFDSLKNQFDEIQKRRNY